MAFSLAGSSIGGGGPLENSGGGPGGGPRENSGRKGRGGPWENSGGGPLENSGGPIGRSGPLGPCCIAAVKTLEIVNSR